jgi:ERCC4-type nuclease
LKSYNNKNYGKEYTLKQTVIPEGFVLLQDTREQRPLFTRIPKGLTIQSTTLKFGDYSLRGFENVFCVERKASDIYSYVSIEREKTVRKMKDFSKMKFVGLVIEGHESDLYKFQQHTKVHPEVVRAALISFEIRYGVHLFIGSKENCARKVLDWSVKFYNISHEV